MRNIKADELDLMTFFECDPKLLDPEDPWFYNDASYNYRKNDDSIIFSLAPSARDVRIIHTIDDVLVFEFNSMEILDVVYFIDESCNEWLTVQISECSKIVISLKPHIKIILNYNC